MKLSALMELLADMAYAYPNTKLPTDQAGQEGFARVWHGVLGDLDDPHVRDAAKHWMRNEKWFPAPSDIRHGAIRSQLGLPTPSAAWSEAVAATGSRDATVWKQSHPAAIQALRDIGGPRSISEATDLMRVRDSYLKAYALRVQDAYENPATFTPIGIPGGRAQAITGGGNHE